MLELVATAEPTGVTSGGIALTVAVFAGFALVYVVLASAIGWDFPGRLPRIGVELRPEEYVVRRGISAESRGYLMLAYRVVLTNQRLLMRRQRFSRQWLDLSLLDSWWDPRPRSKEIELSELRGVLLVHPTSIELTDKQDQTTVLRPQRFWFGSAKAAGEWSASILEFAPHAASARGAGQ